MSLPTDHSLLPTSSYDAIVLGTGGVGSAALLHLARRGLKVLGIDRFPPGHDRGSSHGESRVIRMAYFEHADYVPLLRRAYQLWSELEARYGKPLFHRVGLVEVGPRDGIVVPGVLKSAREHHLAVETIDPQQARERFPGLHIPDGLSAVYEADAGYLLVEECVVAHACAAVEYGASLHIGESVQSWHARGNTLRVITDRDTYSTERLVVTAGAWTNDLLQDLGVPLRVVRKHLHWFVPEQPWYDRAARCPAFLYELPHGVFYGLPQIGASGVKVGEHTGGAEVVDPLMDPRESEALDLARVTRFVMQCLPGCSTNILRHARCFYTMSPDENFIVDRHPAHPQVVFAAGLSGHGFKFTPVLGEVLAEMAVEGKSTQPISFLNRQRLVREPETD